MWKVTAPQSKAAPSKGHQRMGRVREGRRGEVRVHSPPLLTPCLLPQLLAVPNSLCQGLMNYTYTDVHTQRSCKGKEKKRATEQNPSNASFILFSRTHFCPPPSCFLLNKIKISTLWDRTPLGQEPEIIRLGKPTDTAGATRRQSEGSPLLTATSQLPSAAMELGSALGTP